MRRLAVVLLLLLQFPTPAADPGVEFFENRIRPALVTHCYSCHSGQKTKGGLALDSAAGWKKGGESGPAIEPGKPDDSRLIQAIRQTGELKMPPAGPLPAAVVRDFEKWIAQGATDPRTGPVPGVSLEEARNRWSYRPLPPKPAESLDAFIDRQINSALTAKGLKLSPPADPRLLIRRLYLDLLGVPPTPEEVAKFVADSSDAGYARLVDALLADPRFGERQARHWLDVARFAESGGYEHDNDRPHAYTYRDFVIRAFNSDLPFERFVQWQIAGDELRPGHPDAVPATGFLAAGLMNGQVTEREVDKERYEVLDDWVSTVGTAFLGLTVGCARCHDHKFDPIATADYYRLAAYFQPASRACMNVYRDPEQARKTIEEHQRQLASLSAKRRQYEQAMTSRAEQWVAGRATPPAPPWLTLTASDTGFGKTRRGLTSDHDLTRQDDGSYLFTRLNGDVGPFTLVFDVPVAGIRHLRIEALTHDTLPNFGPGLGDRGQFNMQCSVSYQQESQPSQMVKIEKAGATTGDKPGGAGWSVPVKSAGKSHAVVYRFAEPVGASGGGKLSVKISCPGDSPSGRVTIGRFRIAVATTEAAPEILDIAIPAEVYSSGAKDLADGRMSPAAASLFHLVDADWRRLAGEEQAALRDWKRPPYSVVFAVTQTPLPYRLMVQGPDCHDTTHILLRGDPNKKSEVARPTPLPLLTKSNSPTAEGRRADLANWLTDEKNGAGALVARVAANRVWQTHFGQGIVSTSNDFGMQGDSPTHPELLDALAADLIAHGWSLKHLHRAIVLSRAYRQASEHVPDAAKADPGDRLYWRYPPHRLEAEAIRDSWLAVSGRLDPRMFGPGTLDEASTRRSIYFTIKRSKLIPLLAAWDWPEALTGIGRRPTTTVAPQALQMLNHPEVRKAATAVAESLREESDEVAITRMFERVLGRSPKPDEAGAATAFLKSADRAQLVQTLFMTNEFVTLR
ncbi:MAG: PSD1 and planctomycete cytochrome C domain-containing protein [Gemmataceae bacterium]|nr:PSD1 and planctomycete cytochrome C domain-containing protein [Gemmataceae bacterium]